MPTQKEYKKYNNSKKYKITKKPPLGVLISGGKDSILALHRAHALGYEIKVLISVIPKTNESYMFHHPNIHMIKEISKALSLPLIQVETSAKKERELKDLEHAIALAVQNYHIQGIISGAVRSTYQSTRIQRIANKLNIWSFNPLWQNDEMTLLKEMLTNNFSIHIARVAAYPFSKEWLGKRIDNKTIEKLKELNKEYGISIIGEGGEYETFVSDAPLFRNRIDITSWDIQFSKNRYEGEAIIKEYKMKRKTKKEVIRQFQITPINAYPLNPRTIERNKSTHNTPIVIPNTTFERKGARTLIIKTNEQDLHDYEFLEPVALKVQDIKKEKPIYTNITSLINKEIQDKIIHLISQKKIDSIIITGTALKDFKYLEKINELNNIIKNIIHVPTLGICAGAQIICSSFLGLSEDQHNKKQKKSLPNTIKNKTEIGVKKIKFQESNNTKKEIKKNTYFLHQKTINIKYKEIRKIIKNTNLKIKEVAINKENEILYLYLLMDKTQNQLENKNKKIGKHYVEHDKNNKHKNKILCAMFHPEVKLNNIEDIIKKLYN